jgi:hypothetical protein
MSPTWKTSIGPANTCTVRFGEIILHVKRDAAEKRDERSAFLVAVASQKRVWKLFGPPGLEMFLHGSDSLFLCAFCDVCLWEKYNSHEILDKTIVVNEDAFIILAFNVFKMIGIYLEYGWRGSR